MRWSQKTRNGFFYELVGERWRWWDDDKEYDDEGETGRIVVDWTKLSVPGSLTAQGEYCWQNEQSNRLWQESYIDQMIRSERYPKSLLSCTWSFSLSWRCSVAWNEPRLWGCAELSMGRRNLLLKFIGQSKECNKRQLSFCGHCSGINNIPEMHTFTFSQYTHHLSSCPHLSLDLYNISMSIYGWGLFNLIPLDSR